MGVGGAYLGERESTGEDGGVVCCGYVVVEHLKWATSVRMPLVHELSNVHT